MGNGEDDDIDTKRGTKWRKKGLLTRGGRKVRCTRVRGMVKEEKKNYGGARNRESSVRGEGMDIERWRLMKRNKERGKEWKGVERGREG